MDHPLTLVVFDVDGTLVDSQADILGAMHSAFDSIDKPVPARKDVLGIVGLSLDVAVAKLAPDLQPKEHIALVDGYKQAYAANRQGKGAGATPLYDGALDVLRQFSQMPEILLGVATGKSRRGLTALLAAHGLDKLFVTTQVADAHPSKPHPSMLLTAMSETGVDAQRAVMIGDTSYDSGYGQFGWHGDDRGDVGLSRC